MKNRFVGMKSLFVISAGALLLASCGDEVFVDVIDDEDMGDLGVDVGGWMAPDVGGVDEPDMTVIDPGPIPNDGWIGGACGDATDCDYENSTCLDWPGGTCSQPCDRFCPDQDGLNSVTFCIEEGGEGACVARCDYDLFPDGGCRDGYTCQIRSRYQEAGTQQAVCVPDDGMNPNATSACLEELDQLGVLWAPWDYETQYDDGIACTIDDPIRVASPINGIDYRYYSQSTPSTMAMACPLAKSLHKLGTILDDYDIDTVLHIGTFNCRKIAGSSSLSQHSYGLAIDIWGFEDVDGANYVLEEHWQHDTDSPTNEKARVLYEIGQRMHSEEVFNIVLTPNYNSAHDNHFHVDLKVGGNFIGYQVPEYWIGNDRDVCPGWE